MYHTSINSKSSKLSIAPTLDTHTRFLGQSLRGLRGLRGSFMVRQKSKIKISVIISFFHIQILELRVESPAPRSFRSMVSSVATSAESPQRRRVTSAPPSNLSATATFFFHVQKSTRQQVSPPLSPCATARRPKHAKRSAESSTWRSHRTMSPSAATCASGLRRCSGDHRSPPEPDSIL